MTSAVLDIENTRISGAAEVRMLPEEKHRTSQSRPLMMFIALAMALATLAPVAVLVG